MPVAPRRLPRVARPELDDVQVQPHATQVTAAVGLVVQPFGDDGVLGPPRPLVVTLVLGGVQVVEVGEIEGSELTVSHVKRAESLRCVAEQGGARSV